MNHVEKARIGDALQMHRLINEFAAKGMMLARPLSEIYEHIRDYLIIKDNGQVIACVALHVNWSDLAEIKSLAVAEDRQKQGNGNRLIEACLDDAKKLGISTVFCLTYKPEVFERFGFAQIDKMELPQKVWNECYNCPKFPNCDEIALIHHLDLES